MYCFIIYMADLNNIYVPPKVGIINIPTLPNVGISNLYDEKTAENDLRSFQRDRFIKTKKKEDSKVLTSLKCLAGLTIVIPLVVKLVNVIKHKS